MEIRKHLPKLTGEESPQEKKERAGTIAGQDEKGNRECVYLQTYEPMTDEELKQRLNHNNSIMLSIGDGFVSYKESGESAVFLRCLTKEYSVIIIITGGETMRINTRFTVAVHILALIALNDADPATSEMMAMSVGNHPVAVRQVMSSLKKAGLIITQNGLPGGQLAKPQEEISLCEVYQAVKKSNESALFDFHPNPNPECPVGCNIKAALNPPLVHAQRAMENALKAYTLKDITAYISEKYAEENENH